MHLVAGLSVRAEQGDRGVEGNVVEDDADEDLSLPDESFGARCPGPSKALKLRSAPDASTSGMVPLC